MKIAILVALVVTVLEAQPIEVRSFSQLAPLDGNWKFSPDDDSRFAAPGAPAHSRRANLCLANRA